MDKEISLCRPCFERKKNKRLLKLIKQGVDMKITCACCGRRRFGAVYIEIQK